MKNYIIGIGGTGAKCLEHLLHCCSAGLGPNNLWAGMVDQDEANGNVNKTKILLNKSLTLVILKFPAKIKFLCFQLFCLKNGCTLSTLFLLRFLVNFFFSQKLILLFILNL